MEFQFEFKFLTSDFTCIENGQAFFHVLIVARMSMFHWKFVISYIFSVSLKFGACYITFVSHLRNRTLINEKLELTIRNCQENCVELNSLIAHHKTRVIAMSILDKTLLILTFSKWQQELCRTFKREETYS